MRGLTPRTFYSLAIAGPVAGAIYLWWVRAKILVTDRSATTGLPDLLLCPINRVTGIPCPSCGTSRTILQILEPDLIQSNLFNPLGIIVLATLFVLPIWSFRDIIRGETSLYLLVGKGEQLLYSNRILRYALLALIAAIWLGLLLQRYYA